MRYVPDTEDNADRCSCPGCPSNPDQDALLYCARKPYKQHVEEKGCLCPDCPVFRAYDLSGKYYCEAAMHTGR